MHEVRSKGTLFESHGKSKPNRGDRKNQKPCGNFDSCSFAQALGKEIAEIYRHSKKFKREHCRHHGHDVSASGNSSSFWDDGSSSCIANLGDSLDDKIKRIRLDINSPTYNFLMKATYICRINEQVHKMKYGKTTAIFSFPFYKGVVAHSRAKGRHNRQLWQVLLDSGSDGDLLFERRDP